jgi:uncharacterized tellurite resistance protein B-like protein
MDREGETGDAETGDVGKGRRHLGSPRVSLSSSPRPLSVSGVRLQSMFASIRSFFAERAAGNLDKASTDLVRVAACALLLELAHADDDFSEEERQRITRAAIEMGVEESELRDVLALAEAERRESVDLFQFTRLVAESFSREERLRLVEAIWGVVYSDGVLTEAENHLARRIAELLGFQHPEVQAVKEKVAERRR